MTDFEDQLRDELERRAASVPTGRDWAKQELLPGVLSAIDTRPQRVTTSRAPAFVGLAAAATIVLILVVAMPRLSIAPGQTASPDSSSVAVSTAPSEPAALTVISAGQFAARLRAGTLGAGDTVLVDGSIVKVDKGLILCFTSNGLCDFGTLANVDPPIEVEARWTQVPIGEGSEMEEVPDWNWWSQQELPVTGTLILHVGADNRVEYIGRAKSPEPMTADEASQVDINTLEVGDVLLIDGWLWTPEGPGVTIEMDCQSPAPRLPGLPSRYCQPTSSIVSEYIESGARGHLGRSTESIGVQRDAYQRYGIKTVAGPRVFAVAPRLYGECLESAPCWEWDVVSRLTEAPWPQPSAPPTREIACEPPQPDGGTSPAPVITDETGLIVSCTIIAPASGPVNNVAVANPNGDLRTLDVTWTGTSCDIGTTFVLYPANNGYALQGQRPAFPCDPTQRRHTMRLELASAIDAAIVSASVFNPEPDITPAPRPSGDPAHRPASWDLASSERPTATTDRLRLTVYDPGCLEDPKAPGRLLDPEITYDESSVTITYFVDSAAGLLQCPASGSYPSEVFLDEPLGDRQLVDGGVDFGDRVVSHEDGLLLLQPQHAFVAATDRFGWLIGDDACPKNDSNLPSIDEAVLTEMANNLGSAEGMLGDRLAWLGDPEDAVRELGGFELYRDQERQWFVIALDEGQGWLSEMGKPGDLVLADLTSIPISGDRTIWVPGTWFQGFASPDCDAPDDGTGRVQASDEALDYTIAIGVPQVDHAAREPIDGLEATLEYDGAELPAVITGSGSAFAWMTFEQVDGSLSSALALTADCHPYRDVGRLTEIDFLPSNFSGGQSARLAPGIYRLSAHASFVIADGCTGPGVDLGASIFIRVR